MTGTLALMIRSLRIDARLMRTHLFRLMFVVLIYFMLFSAQQTLFMFGAPGLRFFSSITYLNLFMIVLASVSFFATAITEEKEEATLGLLKMAGVSPAAMLLGKLMPRVIGAVFLLSVQLPFTLLAITLGGVSSQQVFATYCSLLALLVLMANVGLFVSVSSKRSSSASWKMVLLVILFFVIVPWFRMALSFGLANPSSSGLFEEAARTVLEQLNNFSALGRIDRILTTGFAESAFGFQVFSNLAVAAVFFGLAWFSFNYFTRNDQSSASPARGLLFKSMSRNKLLGAGDAWRNALIWKDFHFMSGGKLPMLLKFILYPPLFAAIGFLFSWGNWDWTDHEEVGGLTMGLAMVTFVIELSWCASGVFQSEIKWNTLSSIMQLPLSTAEIAYSKVAGCLIGLLPAVVMFCLGIVIFPEGFAEGVKDVLSSPWGWFSIFLVGFFVHLVAFLSLFVKWGALPLAIAIMFLGQMFLGACVFAMTFRSADGDVIGVFAIIVTIASMAALQFGIGARLRTLAAK